MNYSKMTPYELGEIADKEAIKHLIKYLKGGTKNEKRLSASAINKLSKLYREDCNIAKSYLMNNLSDEYPQVRQYTLKALLRLDLLDKDLDIIKKIGENDEKSYNRVEANSILSKYNRLRKNSGENIKVVSSENRLTKFSKLDKKIECDKGENKLVVDMRKISNSYNEDLITLNDVYPQNKLNKKVRNEFCYEKNILVGKKVELEDIFSDRNFMVFLDYCHEIKYKFDESPTNQMKAIKKFNDLTKDINSSEISREVNELINHYKIFNITISGINKYFSLEQEVSEDLKEEYILLASEFSNILIGGIDAINMKQRDIEILKLRYNLDGHERRTLQSIGYKYDISRERVRQIVRKSNRRLTNAFRRYKHRELFKLKLFISKLLRPGEIGFEKRFVLFLIYGFESADIRVLINLLTEVIFEKEREDDIQHIYDKYINELNKKIETDKKLENQINIFNKRINDKIIWFSNVKYLKENDYINIMPKREVNFDTESYRGDFYSSKMKKKIQYESQLEKEILSLLEESPQVVFYVVQPFKIPYYYLKQRNYIPDIFCVLDDGKGVVIEVKPRFNMVLNLNLQKYYRLKNFCEENGYGMLVTDIYTSIEEFVTYDYNKAFEEDLLERLRNGPIKWRELSILKVKHNIRYRDIASIVIKNDLIYNMGPFSIEMK